MEFKKKWMKLSTELQKIEYTRITNKFPDYIPAIVFDEGNLGLDKHKFLIKKNMTMGHFIYIIKKRLEVESDIAIFLFVNKSLVCGSQLISSIYKENRDESGFLIFNLFKEETFG